MTTMFHLLLLLAVATTEVTVVSLPPRGGLSLTLTPPGRADLERVGMVSRVKLEIDRVPPAGSHGPGLSTYIVWAVSPEGLIENIGPLDIENGKARIETTTRFEQFGILVTAEPHYMVDQPSSAVVFRNQNPRSADIRRVPVPVTVGTHDYSNLQVVPQGNIPVAVVQARAAFQIAGQSEAGQFAESEFRRARVALDTLEEMLTRQVPGDIVDAAANEAIRRSHQAVVATRQRKIEAALESSRNEAVTLSSEKAQLEARVQQLSQQLAEQQAAADSQARGLQSELADANREIQRATFEGTQATTRLRNAERELADLQRKQEELQRNLSFELLPEAFDARKALTPKGRDALTRISGIAGFMPEGQIRISGNFDNTMETRVRDFLVAAGVAAERIMLIRK
jgi:hypothetical protein